VSLRFLRLFGSFPLILAALAFLVQGASARPRIQWTSDNAAKNQFFVEVSGLDPQQLAVLAKATTPDKERGLAVYAATTITDQCLPMLGDYEQAGEILRFKPRFGLEPGGNYLAVLTWGNRILASAPFAAPRPRQTASTKVLTIYPSANVVPENLLKFYVQFSAAMSRGDIYDHIHLLSERGKAVELPFLEINEELWDKEMMRLTLFIDPGRIKRGVQPLEEIGPALEMNKRFTLVIDPTWLDAAGQPLRQSYRKVFDVGPPDRTCPDPKTWKIKMPRTASRSPLMCDFREPMDHALALRMTWLTTETGQRVPGLASLAKNDSQWVFKPASPWLPANYRLHIQTTIEDLAGNNIGKSFEVDLFEGIQRHLTNSQVTIPIVIPKK
jgi:hypothetical protein